MALDIPEAVPQRIRIAGTNRTPHKIVDIFNAAAKGKTYIKLTTLSDDGTKVFMNKDDMKRPTRLPKDFDRSVTWPPVCLESRFQSEK